MTGSKTITPTADFYEHLGVPAVEVDTTTTPAAICCVNMPCQREFRIDSKICGANLDVVANSQNLPIDGMPRQPSVDGVELDLVKYEGEVYLRKQMWADEKLLILWHPAGEELPHHKHIKVLHRVFRHNLRNGINAIRGWAEVIEESATQHPERAAEAAATIYDRADSLARISDEARRLERLLNTDTQLRSVELNPIVRSVCAAKTDQHEYDTINIDVDEGLSVKANDKLRFVVENLVDNAFRHNTSPTVEIAAEQKGVDKVHLRIADDGTGLPPVEQDIITGRCDIDQLNHGSGLGLWLSRWILDTYYATVDVTTKNQQGTAFVIQLVTTDNTHAGEDTT